jgi:hypothetical protein
MHSVNGLRFGKLKGLNILRQNVYFDEIPKLTFNTILGRSAQQTYT